MPCVDKYRGAAPPARKRGIRVTSRHRGSSFSKADPLGHSSMRDMRHLSRSVVLGSLFIAACRASEHSDQGAVPPTPAQQSAPVAPAAALRTREARVVRPDSVMTSNGAVATPLARSIAALRDPATTPVIRGLYVNRFAAQSGRRMRWLICI